MPVRLAAPDVLLVVLYALVLAALGVYFTVRRSAGEADYLLMSRRLTLLPFVATLTATWYGGILGVGEYSWRYGVSNWIVFGVPYYLWAIVFGLFFAARARRSLATTIPDQLESAYGRVPALAGAVLVFIGTSPGAYVLMLGAILSILTGWGTAVCVVLGTIFSIVYLFGGGLRSDVATDILEFVLMFLGFGILLPFAALTLGGWDFLAANVPPSHFTPTGGRPVAAVLVWYFLALGTMVDPGFYQRCFAAKDERTARRGVLLAIPFWILFDFLTTATGLYARAALPGLDDPSRAYPALAEAVLPPVAKGLFVLGLLATVMSTVNTYALVTAQTLGRDIVGRMRPRAAPWTPTPAGTRWGLVVTGVFSILVALHFRSIIDIWHDLGSIVTPALLLPLASTFSPRLRMSGAAAMFSMTGTALVTFGWVALGRVGIGAGAGTGGAAGTAGADSVFLGIEPIYPGLVFSGLVWAIDRRLARRGEDRRRPAPS